MEARLKHCTQYERLKNTELTSISTNVNALIEAKAIDSHVGSNR